MTNRTILNLAAWAARSLPEWAKRGIYRIGPLARLVRGELNRAAPTGLGSVTIAAGEAQGLQMMLDLQTEKDYWLGTYEPELQAALRELIQPGMVAYDVGANIGYISLIMARLVGPQGRVFAFEALPANLERLRNNLQLNGAFEEALTPTHSQWQRGSQDDGSTSTTEKTTSPGVTLSLSQGEREFLKDGSGLKNRLGKATVVRAAVVDKLGPVDFLVGPSGGMGKAQGSAGRQDVSYNEKLTVMGISLDEFVFKDGNPTPQVVKMDIEGGEVLALPGMARLLKEAHPLVLMELHGPRAAQAAWTILRDAGYRVCQMEAGYPAIPKLEALDWKAYLVGL